MTDTKQLFLEALDRADFDGLQAESALQVCIASIAEIMHCDVVSLYEIAPDRNELTLVATLGLAPSAVGFVTLALGEGVTGWSAKTMAPYLVADVATDTQYKIIPGFDQSGCRSILAVPVVQELELIGALNVQTVEVHEYSKDEVDALICLAGLIAPLFGRWHDDAAARRLRGPKLLSMVQGMAAASLAPRDLCDQMIDGLRAVFPLVDCGVHLAVDQEAGWIGTTIDEGDDIVTVPLGGETRECGVLAFRYRGSGAPPWDNPSAWQYVLRVADQFGIALEHALRASAQFGAPGDTHTYDSLVSLVLEGRGLAALVEQISLRSRGSVSVIDAFGAVLAGPTVEGVNALDVPIIAGEQRLGSLRISGGSASRSMLDAAAHVVALELTKWRVGFEVEMRLRIDLLEMLLEENGLHPREVIARASLSGLDLRQAYIPVMFAVNPDVAEWQNLMALRSLVELVQRRFGTSPRSVVFQRTDGLLALVPSESGAESQFVKTVEEVAAELVGFLRGATIGVGVGRPTVWPEGFRRALRMTARAAEHSRYTGGQRVVLTDELGSQSLLVSVEPEALEDFVRSQLGALMEWDNRSGGDLIATLEAYHLAGDRLNTAAERLFIHVNTMKYRIARIQELTGGALSSPTRRHDLYLALNALRVVRPERKSLLEDSPS